METNDREITRIEARREEVAYQGPGKNLPNAPASRRNEVLAGIKAELPLAIGTIPFGLIYGALALGAGLPASAAQAMSSIVFAGSAQFISAQLLGQSTPAVIVIVTAGLVNLRHALYSASMAPYLERLPSRWKVLLAYLLTDEAYAVAILHYQEEDLTTSPGNKHWFFLAAGLTLWFSWQASTAVGVFLGAAISPVWSLDFTLALTFIGLVVPALKDRAGTAAAVFAGLAAVLSAGLPLKLGLILASLVGIAAGMWVEARDDPKIGSVEK
jgi:4-azaleucine resistance transporter AzlC